MKEQTMVSLESVLEVINDRSLADNQGRVTDIAPHGIIDDISKRALTTISVRKCPAGDEDDAPVCTFITEQSVDKDGTRGFSLILAFEGMAWCQFFPLSGRHTADYFLCNIYEDYLAFALRRGSESEIDLKKMSNAIGMEIESISHAHVDQRISEALRREYGEDCFDLLHTRKTEEHLLVLRAIRAMQSALGRSSE